MKVKIMFLLAVVFAVGVGALIVFLPFKQEKDRLADQMAISSAKEKSLTNKVAEMQAVQTLQIEEQKKSGLVYFSQKTIPLSNNEVRIDILLNGAKDTSVDAVDLVLLYSPTLSVMEIIKGSALPSYPRTIFKDGVITVTGLALPNGNTVTYGKTGEVFAAIVFKRQGQGTVEINTKDTQAYFGCTPILDFASSFKPIKL